MFSRCRSRTWRAFVPWEQNALVDVRNHLRTYHRCGNGNDVGKNKQENEGYKCQHSPSLVRTGFCRGKRNGFAFFGLGVTYRTETVTATANVLIYFHLTMTLGTYFSLCARTQRSAARTAKTCKGRIGLVALGADNNLFRHNQLFAATGTVSCTQSVCLAAMGQTLKLFELNILLPPVVRAFFSHATQNSLLTSFTF